MKNILIKKLILKNFKGIKELVIDFEKITNILGENATGKTTVFDSFCWLLFGKDSKDRKDFEIKTLGPDGEALHGLEHSVIGILDVNGEEITLQRIFTEKWTKKKGLADKVFSGHETTYYINQVPAKQKEYNEKVTNILADNTFKLLSNPLYFNSIEWKKQREILLEIIGDIDQDNVINYKKELKPLEQLLSNNTPIEDFRKKVKDQISKYSKDKESIPFRIDECNNSIVEEDFKILEDRKVIIQNGINALSKQIAAGDNSSENMKLEKELSDLKLKYNSKLVEAKENSNKPLDEFNIQISDKKYEINDLEHQIQILNRDKFDTEEAIKAAYGIRTNYIEKQKSLRDIWHKENNVIFEFDENEKFCPTCHREYEIEQLEEIRTNAQGYFEESKNNKRNSINKQGKELGEKINQLETSIKENSENLIGYEEKLSEYNSKMELLKSELEQLEKDKQSLNINNTITFTGEQELTNSINEIKGKIANFKLTDNTELANRKLNLERELENISKQLGKKDNNETLRKRIQDLQEEERTLANEIAKLEGYDFLCEEFIRTKVGLLEERINSKFKTVRFKLFKQQINGGIDECCEALIDGVPFSNANTASQINAGIEIINTLSEFYEVNAPIFIDNRESINQIVPTDSQIINLIVSKDKELKVECKEKQEVA
ncbi:AAA family ATPase [Clostridium gelidum]|uniref:AAA family ATPase n=1 Tax=Clostridium gelidum TaxID=704125 RepID=A0ABM7TDC4_9CLOT|nr:AAA family ATPase [Clostridium gelidum]BCZ46968.1 AAA family ATPase [Clostridium gelidum]